MGLGCGTPTGFMSAAAARTVHGTTITPVFMGWDYKLPTKITMPGLPVS